MCWNLKRGFSVVLWILIAEFCMYRGSYVQRPLLLLGKTNIKHSCLYWVSKRRLSQCLLYIGAIWEGCEKIQYSNSWSVCVCVFYLSLTWQSFTNEDIITGQRLTEVSLSSLFPPLSSSPCPLPWKLILPRHTCKHRLPTNFSFLSPWPSKWPPLSSQ